MNENELFDYSGKTTEWIKGIRKTYQAAIVLRGPLDTYKKICASADVELKKRGED